VKLPKYQQVAAMVRDQVADGALAPGAPAPSGAGRDNGVPAPCQAGPGSESGRGLEIVASLSLAWGWEPVQGAQEKRTWATLQVP
jgi:hypothetical protein